MECLLDGMDVAYSKQYKRDGSIYDFYECPSRPKTFIEAMELIERAQGNLKMIRGEEEVK